MAKQPYTCFGAVLITLKSLEYSLIIYDVCNSEHKLYCVVNLFFFIILAKVLITKENFFLNFHK